MERLSALAHFMETPTTRCEKGSFGAVGRAAENFLENGAELALRVRPRSDCRRGDEVAYGRKAAPDSVECAPFGATVA